jgi:SAM-dependent methyltransferase
VPDFSRRSQVAEWLDTAAPDRSERAAYLESLAFFNGMMLGRRPILSWLKAATRGGHEPLTLVDVGCGFGDLLRAIRRWSRARGVPLRLIGVDIEPDTIAIAQQATAPDDAIEYLAADVFNLRPAIRIDLIVSSLLAHHLTDERLLAFLRWMETTAQRGWLICDLERHFVPYHAIGAAGRLTGVHPMVVKDGRTSVTRALARAEWRPLVAAAGLDPAAVRLSAFLYRLTISRLKTSCSCAPPRSSQLPF